MPHAAALQNLESSFQQLSETLRVISAFGIKGGCGKSTTTLALAASMKRLFPWMKIGVVDMTTEQGTLSTVFAPKSEARGIGWWGITKAYLDEVEREINPDLVPKAIRAAVTQILVVPGLQAESDGTIDFIPCGKRQLKAIEGSRDLMGDEAVRTCAGVLSEIRDTLGWDLAVVDLPPSTKEIGSRMMLGCCSAVAVTAGLVHRDDLAGYSAMVEEIRRLKIEPAGFLLNLFDPGDTYSETALKEARAVIANAKVPELGLIRRRQTMKSSREPYDWEGATTNTAAGLYVALAMPGMNNATRKGIVHTIHEVEAAAKAVLQAIVASETAEPAVMEA